MIKIKFVSNQLFSHYEIVESNVQDLRVIMIIFSRKRILIFNDLHPFLIVSKKHKDFFINQLDNYDTNKTFEEFERDLNEWIKSLDQKDLEQVLTSTTDKCDHSIKLYTGLMQTYKFCEKCDEKFYDKD